MGLTEIGLIKKELEMWLTRPNQLGRFPRVTKYVKTIKDRDGDDCHIFRFKTQFFAKWTLGVVTAVGPFCEYKEFLPETAERDALLMVHKLKTHWKKLER